MKLNYRLLSDLKAIPGLLSSNNYSVDFLTFEEVVGIGQRILVAVRG